MSHHTDSKQRNESRAGKVLFGHLPDGEPVHLFRIGREDGPSVTISDYGCTLTSLRMPDRTGMLGEVVLGYPQLEQYVQDCDYMGVTVGRYANRIAGAKFVLDGEPVCLSANEGPNHLHGGAAGFGKRLWRGKVIAEEPLPSILMQRSSPDGEEGYPGTLNCTVLFTLRDEHLLDVVFEAETDRPTIVNMTLHPYFNLAGDGREILDHRVSIFGDSFLPVDESSLPTGERRAVEGTPMDFRRRTPIGLRIRDEDEQLALMGGFDHCWILDGIPGQLNPAALVYDPASGRTLDVLSTAPGLQFYTGNTLGRESQDEKAAGLKARTGFCLEPQLWPDSPNRPDFPSARLDPGDRYVQQIRYCFGINETV